jgi:hypothetical protein
MKIQIQILALMLASALIAVTVLISQQASAIIIICSVQKIADFQQLTSQFQKAVLKESPEPHLIGEFTKLMAQLKRDVISAAQTGDTTAIRGFIINWHDAASRIFLGSPNTIPQLLDDYNAGVLRIFAE